MKALILAAGLGSRLGPITSHGPKALTCVKERPILRYQLEALRRNGIHELVVVLGYFGEQVVQYVTEEGPDFQVTYITNPDYATTNSSYSWWLAREHVAHAPYIHLNCDVFFSDGLLNRVLASPHEHVIAIRTDMALGGRLEHVGLDGERITEMSLSQTPRSRGKAYGFAKFGPASSAAITRRMEAYLHRGDRNQHCFGLIREAISELPYHALDATPDLLLEVNTPDELQRAEQALIDRILITC